MKRRVPPKQIHLGDRILCSDKVAREVMIIDHLGGGTFRFTFTDDKWLECKAGETVTRL